LELEGTEIQNRLRSLVASLPIGGADCDDLMQEALIHLNERMAEEPGHAVSFYLQSCRFLIMNCLRQGCSIDSAKRHRLRQPIDDFAQEVDDPFPLPDALILDEQAVASLAMAEICEKLRLQLRPPRRQIFELLLEGVGIREIALRLNISHPAVVRHRLRIAELAVCLGLIPALRQPEH
jgi:RNA polymerase sigma factor (sigma-70 family)